MSRRGCEAPIPLQALLDYWFGDLSAADSEKVEDHLFECDACGDLLRAFLALGDGVRSLARQGAVQVVVTSSFLDAAYRAGLRTREYTVAPGGRVDCTVTPQDDLLISRTRADFTGVSRLDVLWQVEGRNELLVQDVPVSPDAEELIVALAMPMARALDHVVFHLRLISREGTGDRVLGDYTFDHTPTPAS